MSKQKQAEIRWSKHWTKALKNDYKCYCQGCDNLAINSHILQKNGILNEIKENGQIVMSIVNYMDTKKFPFKEIGINKAYTFKGFCSTHDKDIFKPIEDCEIDFDDYKTQLLFVYRTIMDERRRKEILIDYFNRIINDDFFSDDSIYLSSLKIEQQNYRQDIAEIDILKNSLLSDLDTTSQSFTFYVKETPKQDVCISSLFTYQNISNVCYDIIINYFPIENCSILIIGYHNTAENICGDWVRQLIGMNDDGTLSEINKLMHRRCEMWACSKTFYKDKIEPIEEDVLRAMEETAADVTTVNKDVDFNLFS